MREGIERREELIQILKNAEAPISGGALAKRLGVSRQVIVTDIALLRAVNKNILSTSKGYMLYIPNMEKKTRIYMVSHTHAQIEEELNAIVDNGGEVKDVFVEHEIYGTITVDLALKNRADVRDFVNKTRQKNAVPLMELTNQVHFHTVEAEQEADFDRIRRALAEKGFLKKDFGQ